MGIQDTQTTEIPHIRPIAVARSRFARSKGNDYFFTTMQRNDRETVRAVLEDAKVRSLDGHSDSPFRIVRKLSAPRLESSIAPWLLGLFITCELAAIWFTYQPYNDLQSIAFGLFIQIVPVAVFSFLWSARNEKRHRKYADLSDASIEELERCLDDIEYAMLQLEDTPGGMISYKIYDGYVYFVIAQLRDTLRDRIHFCRKTLNKGTTRSVENTMKLLKSPLAIQLSVLRKSDAMAEVQLWALYETCKGLFRHLFEGHEDKRNVA